MIEDKNKKPEGVESDAVNEMVGNISESSLNKVTGGVGQMPKVTGDVNTAVKVLNVYTPEKDKKQDDIVTPEI